LKHRKDQKENIKKMLMQHDMACQHKALIVLVFMQRGKLYNCTIVVLYLRENEKKDEYSGGFLLLDVTLHG